jgi:uncharacterized protein YdeI (YjbR/CyaY-like superfamily)
MPKTDKRIDAYIDNAPDFAQPILTRVRQIVHEACPDVEETLKWGHPSFMYHGIMCGMASFKDYCAFHFWKGGLIIEIPRAIRWAARTPPAFFDLPPKRSSSATSRKRWSSMKGPPFAAAGKAKKELVMPEPFMAAIKKNKKALAGFEAFSPSHKREYIEWITDAKGEDTQKRRIAQAVEWMAEGKPRNWKYM